MKPNSVPKPKQNQKLKPQIKAGKKSNPATPSIESQKHIVNFLFEIGTMRKLMRIHRQVLLTDDQSDSIASHSYRVALISWFLAKQEGVDPYKTVMMALIHDVGEVRSNDHNWVHKKYIKIFENEINEEQLNPLPYPDLMEFIGEYELRESREAILAKEADTLDQLLLLREYEWNGNQEARLWLYGTGKKKTLLQLEKLKTDTARRLGKLMYEVNPSDWWKKLSTSVNRK